MPRLTDIDLRRHDGNKPELQLTVDFYPDADPGSKPKRYLCAGKGLTRFFVKGDIPRLVKHAGSGNIDFVRMDSTADTEIVVRRRFGGMIEAEAKAFTLMELKS